jgi:hypothetical protein
MNDAQQSKASYAPLLTLILLLVVGTLMPGDVKAAIESRFWHGIPWSGLAHLVLFTAIAGQKIYGSSNMAQVRRLALALVLAATTELFQNWVPGRHPLLRDVGIDMCGALLGTLSAYFLSRRHVAFSA